MVDLKAMVKKEDFLGKMKEYENSFYGIYEKSMQDNLLDELKKKEFFPEQQESEGFLRAPTQVEKDYMQGQYRYNKFSRQKDDEQSAHLRSHFQLSQEGQFNTYVPPKYNYIDVQANSKQYYPDQEMFIKDFNRPQQSFSNAQNIFLNRTMPSNLQGQDVKNVFPRKLFNPHDKEVSHPYFLAQEAPAQALRQNIQKLGGIQDTISVMEPSLRDHERQAFFEKGKFDVFTLNQGVNDAQYKPFPDAAVTSNVQNIQSVVPPPPPPTEVPIPYNPFETNPYARAKMQSISPMISGNELYSAYNFGGGFNSQQGRPSSIQIQKQQSGQGYDKFLHSHSRMQSGQLSNPTEGRSQFDLGPVFINGAHNY